MDHCSFRKGTSMKLDIKDSPVFDELTRQMNSKPELIDASALWRASGRKRNKSPRAWLCKDNIVHDPGGSPDVPIMITVETAFQYVQILCNKILMAANAVFSNKLKADPARHVMGYPDQIMGILAVGATMEGTSMTQEEAAAHITKQVAERTSGLGEYAQETAVAKAQRAVKLRPNTIIKADR